MKIPRFLVAALVPAAGGAFCASSGLAQSEQSPTSKKAAMKLELSSPAFSAGQPIPARHSCDGADVSPSLQWSGAPPGTQTFALICDDPDAPFGTWVHWVLWNLPASATVLEEAQPRDARLSNGGEQGINDFKKSGYGGPCPPGSKPHRDFFKLYALDTALTLKAGARKKDLLRAMEGHVLAETSLMGTYQRLR